MFVTAEIWDAWSLEAYRLYQEKRFYYILDDYLAFQELRGIPTPW
jgi:hypothetical protein